MKKVKLDEKDFSVGKIVCVGRNYAKHAEELGNEVPKFPLIFLKPSSVIIYSGDKIVHPPYSKEMHYETELVLLIGEKIKNATAEEAERAIAGYAVGLDMTLRDIQTELKAKGHPWTLAKVFDGSAVLGDFVSVNEHPLTFEEFIRLKVTGEIKQDSKLKRMLLKPVEIVQYISSKITLEEGDLIFTGTPEGVGKAHIGDVLEAEIEGLPKLLTSVSSSTPL